MIQLNGRLKFVVVSIKYLGVVDDVLDGIGGSGWHFWAIYNQEPSFTLICYIYDVVDGLGEGGWCLIKGGH